MDADELAATRAALRPGKTEDTADRVKATYGNRYDYRLMQQAKADIAVMLGENSPAQERRSIRQHLREASGQQEYRRRKSKEHKQER